MPVTDKQYQDGEVKGPSQGTLMMGTDGTLVQAVKVDADGKLELSGVISATTGTEYADGAARGTATGQLAMGDDGVNIQALHVNANGSAQVDVLTLPAVVIGPPTIPWDAWHDEITAQTNHALKAAPGSGLSLYVTDIILSNEGPEGYVFLVEDTAGAATQRTIKFYVGQYGGPPIRLATPLKITANKDVGFTSNTMANHGVQIVGYTAA